MIATRLLSPLFLATLATAWVDLDPNLVPEVNGPLPLYELGQSHFLPNQWLEEILGNVAPGAKFVHPEGSGGNDSTVYAYDGEDIVGYINKQTGETRIFPNYAKLEPSHKPIDIEQALKIFGNGSHELAFPPDDTEVELIKGPSLVGSDFNATEDGSNLARRSNNETFDFEPAFLRLGFFGRFLRNRGGRFSVVGRSSRVAFAINAASRFTSLAFSWKPAKTNGQLVEPKPKHEIVKQIKKLLEAKALKSYGIKITRVDLIYYDSGMFLQPVYRIIGDTYALDRNKVIDTLKIFQYFPIGYRFPEPIPEPASWRFDDPAPITPPEVTSTSSKRSLLSYFDARSLLRQGRGIKPTVTVGRYVTRNDTYEAEFLSNANGIWSALSTSSIINFVNKQYYWAYPWLYGSLANYFVNSVNIAFTESHGTNHLFSTYGASGSVDAVSIPKDILAGGYGAGNGGALGYWVINSCEVIPARIDFPNDPSPLRRAFDPWWPVFNGGLHAVLGWRTSPFFSDDVAVNTAKAIALGLPVASAWLDAAHSDPAFDGRPTYTGHVTGVVQPIGRAAVVYPCGHGSDKVWQLEGLGKPSCLTMRYWNND